ncbi:extensin family protein [uncultured Friedmanniella sp.]|uniref:extensin family protein n=1 Tax=uncultured Friedmanniella sp. TaxID=335381 RepID=UPI0035CC917E
MKRRQLLRWAGASSAALLVGGCSRSPDGSGSSGADAPDHCVARSTLAEHKTLEKLPLVYEISQRRESFAFEPGFFGQLGRWLRAYRKESGLAAPDQVWTYGAYVDGGSDCSSWHAAGRAFDLSRLRLPGVDFVSCRHDRWRSSSGEELRRALRRYWALAASLHHDFAYVLTYEYNATHANHIHVDNGRSGSGLSKLSTSSTSQLQAVQAICTHLWDEPVEVTGAWDAGTRAASRRVLDRIGHGGDLNDSAGAWRAFLKASVPRGAAPG